MRLPPITTTPARGVYAASSFESPQPNRWLIPARTPKWPEAVTIAEFIHAQMQAHHWEKVTDHEVIVKQGFTMLKPLAFTAPADEPIHDFRAPVADKTRIAQMIFGGFKKCLYPVQKFQSDTERVLSVILDRESKKWFKPGRG